MGLRKRSPCKAKNLSTALDGKSSLYTVSSYQVCAFDELPPMPAIILSYSLAIEKLEASPDVLSISL